MIYQVYEVCPELTPFVRCFWSLEGEIEKVPVGQRIVPDGCMEMILHYGDLYEQFFDDGTSRIQPRSFIYGQITRYIEIASTGVTGIIAARFQPEGLVPFLDFSIEELGNKAVPLSTIFNEAGEKLEKSIVDSADAVTRIKIIEQFLLSLLSSPEVIDKVTRNCVELILFSQGQMPIEQLAETSNIHRRNLERKFETNIGMSPKRLARIIRLQHTLKMLQQNQSINLTSVAYENGYFDQAHFIRDFKEITGLNPKSFYKDNMKFAAFFASGD